MGWLIIVLLVLVALIAYTYTRKANHSYRFGSGLFKSSENNLEDEADVSDMDYYDKDNLMK